MQLAERIRDIVEAEGGTLEAKISGEAFLIQPGELSALVSGAITAETASCPSSRPAAAHRMRAFCPRFARWSNSGLLNATMHKLDEAVALADLEQLAAIYGRILGATATGS